MYFHPCVCTGVGLATGHVRKRRRPPPKAQRFLPSSVFPLGCFDQCSGSCPHCPDQVQGLGEGHRGLAEPRLDFLRGEAERGAKDEAGLQGRKTRQDVEWKKRQGCEERMIKQSRGEVTSCGGIVSNVAKSSSFAPRFPHCSIPAGSRINSSTSSITSPMVAVSGWTAARRSRTTEVTEKSEVLEVSEEWQRRWTEARAWKLV
mmetsp:Transcript_19224/g.39697  ORF Transcript_19224/g.39697 Transcript_19224/m.39697 type:complete len:203 (+) Transcript_19224:1327-1935(+)